MAENCDGLSLEQTQALLDTYVEAAEKIASGAQEYEIETPSGRRRVKRANLKELWDVINDLRAQVSAKKAACGQRTSRFSLASFNHELQDL